MTGWKVNSVHLFPSRRSAEIDVPGLGAVTVVGFISDETLERVYCEALAALRTKLGQTIDLNPYGTKAVPNTPPTNPREQNG